MIQYLKDFVKYVMNVYNMPVFRFMEYGYASSVSQAKAA